MKITLTTHKSSFAGRVARLGQMPWWMELHAIHRGTVWKRDHDAGAAQVDQGDDARLMQMRLRQV